MIGIPTSVFFMCLASTLIVFNAGVFLYFRFFASSDKKESKNEMRKKREYNFEGISKEVSYSQNVISTTDGCTIQDEETIDELYELLNDNNSTNRERIISEHPSSKNEESDGEEVLPNDNSNVANSYEEELADPVSEEYQKSMMEHLSLDYFTMKGFESSLPDEFDGGLPIQSEDSLLKTIEVLKKNDNVSHSIVKQDFSNVSIETKFRFKSSSYSEETDGAPEEIGEEHRIDQEKMNSLLRNGESPSEPNEPDLDEPNFEEPDLEDLENPMGSVID